MSTKKEFSAFEVPMGAPDTARDDDVACPPPPPAAAKYAEYAYSPAPPTQQQQQQQAQTAGAEAFRPYHNSPPVPPATPCRCKCCQHPPHQENKPCSKGVKTELTVEAVETMVDVLGPVMTRMKAPRHVPTAKSDSCCSNCSCCSGCSC